MSKKLAALLHVKHLSANLRKSAFHSPLPPKKNKKNALPDTEDYANERAAYQPCPQGSAEDGDGEGGGGGGARKRDSPEIARLKKTHETQSPASKVFRFLEEI